MKRGLILGLAIAIFSLFFIILRNGMDTGEIRVKGTSFIEGLKIVQKSNGVNEWILYAKKADFLEGDNRANLTGIRIFLPKNDIMLYADKGLYNFKNKSFITDCAVKAKTKDYIIVADSIDFDVKTGTVETSGWIKLDSDKFKIEGKGMKAEEDGVVTIFDNVKAILYD